MTGRGKLMVQIINEEKEDPEQPAATDDSRPIQFPGIETLNNINELVPSLSILEFLLNLNEQPINAEGRRVPKRQYAASSIPLVKKITMPTITTRITIWVKILFQVMILKRKKDRNGVKRN
ncbi:unnamed protein product [Parnassius apollo]|uniref:(apollo) hypothetical protein n=1 Tax=Parnassius apollo TaxID=110799 RepID=A0A8S3XWX0_PARAO|nr:unnamed protein product [Parnassius apollo]